MFTVIAHRGDSSSRPENTFEAFDHAIQQGFHHIETDCQLSKDGRCVVLHDEKLGRTNNGTGLAWEHDHHELLQLDAGSWFSAEYSYCRIPTLTDLLHHYHGRVHLHLELKSAQPNLPRVALDELQASGWLASTAGCAAFGVPGLTITSFHLQQLKAIKQMSPGVRCAWLVHDLPASVVEAAQQLHLDGVCPRANIISKDEVAAARAAGLTVRAWGIKTEQLLMDAAAAGADGATANWPSRARELLQQGAAGEEVQQ